MDTELIALADQCVMCGLCLPYCPTYKLADHEAESPRGRIAMARHIAQGSLAPDPATLLHLDHCLGCLNCEKVCPSQVQYEKILVRTRAMLAPLRVQTRMSHTLSDPRRLHRLARAGVALHAQRWLPKLARVMPPGSLLRRAADEMPQLPKALPPMPSRAMLADRETVLLFRGCVADVFDRDTHAAARILLEALGHRVIEPANLCCGALPLHAGNSAVAERSQASTRETLLATGASTILVSSSGCLGSLRDDSMADSGVAVVDIASFLTSDSRWPTLRFRPLSARAALHRPCTQITVGDGGSATRALLARIPQLDILDLPDQPRCCGAAGSHFLQFPEPADRLRAQRVEQVGTLAPDLLLTSNIGCRIFLDNGLRQRGANVPTLHPLTLLAQQLEHPEP